MCDFFLLYEANDVSDIEVFKNGISNLIAIRRRDNHKFYKHNSIYELSFFEEIYKNYSGDVEKSIMIFLEQMNNITENIDSELKANVYCSKDVNGFLGIDFSCTTISTIKQIIDEDTYNSWIEYHSTNLEKLDIVLGENFKSSQFESDFNDLIPEVQNSIINYFQKAKDRKLKTPFFPDTKIISNVTPKNSNLKLYELRIYSPVAIRVYFNESKEKVYLASIEGKANPNQNKDIRNACSILDKL